MNVIVSNKYQSMLETLQIDVIKSINGEFDVDEIIRTFDNFYFQRMILDVTAIKDYKDIKNIQKLSISLDMSKVILLLDDSPECSSDAFLSKLVSVGIYNFTKNVDGIMYLYNTPNSYRDVAHIQQLDTPAPVMMAAAGAPAMQGQVASPMMQMGPRVIGFKGSTKEAGATSLVYMIKKELEQNYRTTAIEVDKRDFMFLRDKDLLSTTSQDIGNVITKNSSYEVILIDVNGSKVAEGLCNDMIYLIEPSTIKLNRMMLVSTKALKDLSGKKVVLNKSLLKDGDIKDFEYESGLKILFNLPPLDDREKNNPKLNMFLRTLGFDRQQVAE